MSDSSGESLSLARRVAPLLEVAAVMAAVVGVTWALQATSFRAWQVSHFGKPFLYNLFFLLLPPLAICVVTRREPRRVGLAFGKLRQQVRLGIAGGVMLLMLTGWAFPVLGLLGTSYKRWGGAALLTILHLAAAGIILRHIRSHPTPDTGPGTKRGIAWFALMVLGACLLGMALASVSRVAGDIVFKLVFVGLAEELLLRGYVQSRLNDAFGRPFRFCGVPWGWGIVCAAILFGVLHPLLQGPPRPWPWALWTAAFGLTAGLLREKSGGVTAPALAHGLFVLPTVFFGN